MKIDQTLRIDQKTLKILGQSGDDHRLVINQIGNLQVNIVSKYDLPLKIDTKIQTLIWQLLNTMSEPRLPNLQRAIFAIALQYCGTKQGAANFLGVTRRKVGLAIQKINEGMP